MVCIGKITQHLQQTNEQTLKTSRITTNNQQNNKITSTNKPRMSHENTPRVFQLRGPGSCSPAARRPSVVGPRLPRHCRVDPGYFEPDDWWVTKKMVLFVTLLCQFLSGFVKFCQILSASLFGEIVGLSHFKDGQKNNKAPISWTWKMNGEHPRWFNNFQKYCYRKYKNSCPHKSNSEGGVKPCKERDL